MTPNEILDDLDERLMNAAFGLADLAANADTREERLRLAAKRTGVLLAQDYLRSYR